MFLNQNQYDFQADLKDSIKRARFAINQVYQEEESHYKKGVYRVIFQNLGTVQELLGDMVEKSEED